MSDMAFESNVLWETFPSLSVPLVHPSSAGVWNALAALAFGVVCAGCKAATAPDPANLKVTVLTSRPTAAPGEAILVTVRAEPLGTSTVSWITLSTAGLVVTRDSIAVTGAGPQELVRTITLPLKPLSGTLTISGSASVGASTASDQETVDVFDGVAPSIVSFVAEPIPAQPGDSTHFNFDVRDDVGVSRIQLRVDSAFVGERVLTFDPSTPRAAGTAKIKVPNDIAIGRRAKATLTVFDESGHSREASLTYDIRDTRPPAARLAFGGLHADHTIGTGETIQIIADVTDNHQLLYIGYEGDGRRDSVAVTGSAATRAFPLVVPAAWQQSRPVFFVWARDVNGNVSPSGHDAVGTPPVYDWTEYPKVIIPFPNEPHLVDVVWDSRRSVVYLLRADLEGIRNNSSIDVIQIPSGSVTSSIAVGVNAVGLSLTASGDSLVTTLPDQRALGVVDLTMPQRTLALLPLQHLNQDRRPLPARVSGSHVFVPFVDSLYIGRLIDVNLATGTQTIRGDIGGTSELTSSPILLPLSAGRLLLHREVESYLHNDTFLYGIAADAFNTVPKLPPLSNYRYYSTSLSGRFMLGDRLFSATFAEIDSIGTQDWVGQSASALSVDGESAYLSTQYGYKKIRLADEFVLEQVKLEMIPFQFLLLPSGNTLIAIGHLPGTNKSEYCLMVIDLR